MSNYVLRDSILSETAKYEGERDVKPWQIRQSPPCMPVLASYWYYRAPIIFWELGNTPMQTL